MKNDENIKLVEQVYLNFGSGNVQGILDALTDDITWEDPGYPEVPYAAHRKGKAEVLSFFQEMASTVAFTHFKPQEIYSDLDAVIFKGYFSGNSIATKKPFESDWVMIWKIRDHKIYSYQAWVDTVRMAKAIAP